MPSLFHSVRGTAHALLAHVIFLCLPLRGQITAMLDDSFTDGERVRQNPPASLAWFTPGGAVSGVSARAGSLAMNANNDDRLIWGYFPARTIDIGDSLTLHVSFSFNRTPPAGTGSFKVALCSSNDRPLRQSDGGPPNGAYTGYASFTNPADGTAGTRLRKRSGPAAANTTATLLELSDGASDVVWDTFGAARTGLAGVLQGNTAYSVTLKVTRTGVTTARITTAISGGALDASNTLSESDPTDIFTHFDTVAIGAAEAVQSGDLTITRVQIIHEVNTSRLTNLSILTEIAASGDDFRLGYVVGGPGTSGPKPLVIRASGPSLAALGVDGTLDDPKLELFAGPAKSGENDNWGGALAVSAAIAQVGAFAFSGAASSDAAVLADATTADNSVRVSAAGNGTGTVLAEVYDATPGPQFTKSTRRLINVSVLKHLGGGITLGFVVGGEGTKTVLIRAIGPTLGADPFGVAGVVADPRLELYSGATRIGENDNWAAAAPLATAFDEVGAFHLPAASRDSALIATLPAGNYTVQVSGVNATTGVALVEVYELP